MSRFTCTTCGTQYPESPEPPADCAICLDERQWVRWQGQEWTTPEKLAETRHIRFRREDDGIWGIGTEPMFAIGQRPLLIQRPEGNILWDCMSFIDDEAVALINELGGVSAIAISHPHFFSAMADWSRAFGDVPIHLHADHEKYVVQGCPAIEYWEGDTKTLADDLTLIRVGGHYTGSTVLHAAHVAGGRGGLFPGDSIRVANDRDWLCFMYSYVNFIPLSAGKVEAIWNAVEPFAFDRLYGYWFEHNVMSGAKEKLRKSVDRYIAFLQE